ncbi:PilW family protein [Candidatus Omnitrophota bacterium]
MRRLRSGFTLVELMGTILIFTIILLGTITIFTIGKNSWQIGAAQLDVQQEARRAMESMVRELRQSNGIDGATFVNGVSNNLIRFTLGALNIEFRLNQAGFNPDQLIRSQGGANTVLANSIQSVQFDLLGGNVVYITLTAQKRSRLGHLVDAVVVSQVALRN